MSTQISKCIGFEEQGGSLKLTEISLPTVGPRDLVVRVEAVSMNPIDFKKKDYGVALGPVSVDNPCVLGFDASGVVVQTGEKVTLFKVGDEVMYAGDITKQGSNSQLQVIDERIVGKKPNNLNWAEAASIPLVHLTVYESLAEHLEIKEQNKDENKNKTILIVGGAGGVGSAAIQQAKNIFNLKVIATASRPESVDYCKKQGADIVINHKNSLIEELKALEITGVDYIFNTSDMTPFYFDQFTALINPFGGIVGISGFLEPLIMAPLFLKRVKVSCECMFVRSLYGKNQEIQNKILNKICLELENRNITHNLEVLKDFNIENLTEGHNVCKSGVNIGKIAYQDVQKFFNN
ncbi:zinc-binding alcohol dehydrogenase family protein (macronuclear) [Tetrahymena thermophila SB210]|uniref:Zinc-binding alcohol dehydrogenase family protein n=1 Tax=Tetrahymena thermophila (strain SB210) TaxID=312017 RepID=I7MIB1_TETTS|nr:zinc-binding alcohol dehydrogenase family protein [Tetrahymena thermophila SB210]EAR92836.1 zinc-binding alcohol dehydrogenase family protein [Tetrahymena thermophila SB210]|eukprot:XP_001013081.1 zinc-binding alcohol dehydrogenase family protein [Tetrahymena thermophila SB210]